MDLAYESMMSTVYRRDTRESSSSSNITYRKPIPAQSRYNEFMYNANAPLFKNLDQSKLSHHFLTRKDILCLTCYNQIFMKTIAHMI